ncbi:epimerase [Subtercola boreus]|uniref:Epimerase n=1 Tax=Subtercola boreus TaxID=120213 RepID=A0A3E0W150_9MICO|nr:NAD-dependent epimerase/dehydratase family protein [Subtercola boreus]RFA15243.1 epimerase [Subtercola boreus]
MLSKALIAGGAGFVGSHLTDRLLDEGWEVTVVDNLITGFDSNLAHLAEHPRLTFLHMNAEDAGSIDETFDLVLHFASPASPPRYLAHPIETMHAGSIVTEALLRIAERDGARFILSSTSEVYGDPSVHPQTEEYWGNVSSTGPRSVYDEAKRYAEAISFAFHRTHGVDIGVVRLFNTYGPRMDPDDGRAVPAFVKAALADAPIPLHGDGLQTRSLCFIDDQVDGILALAASHETGPINIGNPHEQSLLEIAELVIQLTGSSSTIEFHPRPVDDPERRQPDITKAQELLSWNPRVDVVEGLTRTIDWFRTHGNTK